MDVTLQRQSTIEGKCKVGVKVSFKKSCLFLIFLLGCHGLKNISQGNMKSNKSNFIPHVSSLGLVQRLKKGVIL